jgi:hypothetical protein
MLAEQAIRQVVAEIVVAAVVPPRSDKVQTHVDEC